MSDNNVSVKRTTLLQLISAGTGEFARLIGRGFFALPRGKRKAEIVRWRVEFQRNRWPNRLVRIWFHYPRPYTLRLAGLVRRKHYCLQQGWPTQMILQATW